MTSMTLWLLWEFPGTNKCLTQTRYVAYQLHIRENKYSTLLRGGRLLQRFIVNMFVSIDQDHLYWLRTNQAKIRACLYSGLEDAVAQGDDDVDLHTLTSATIKRFCVLGVLVRFPFSRVMACRWMAF